jgi:hypothetical protein
MKQIFWKEVEAFTWAMLLPLNAKIHFIIILWVNPLNAELNSSCHLLALLGAHHILHVSRRRVKLVYSSHIRHGRYIDGGNIFKKLCFRGRA